MLQAITEVAGTLDAATVIVSAAAACMIILFDLACLAFVAYLCFKLYKLFLGKPKMNLGSTLKNEAERIEEPLVSDSTAAGVIESSAGVVQPESPVAEEKKTRVAVYVDGNNFFLSLKQTDFSVGKKAVIVDTSRNNWLDNIRHFNFDAFIAVLCSQKECVSRKYFCGEFSESGKTKEYRNLMKRLHRDQLADFEYLKAQGFAIRDFSRLAEEMQRDAAKELFDEAILISSNVELAAALYETGKLGKKTTIIGFSERVPKQLKDAADYQIVVSGEMLRKYIDRFSRDIVPDNAQVLKTFKKEGMDLPG